jgi:outer membrane protein OmpA-like peptidoglycan-associated protein
MKQIRNTLLAVTVAVLALGLAGCRKKPIGLTHIPGQKPLPPVTDAAFPPAGGGGEGFAGGMPITETSGIDATPDGLTTDPLDLGATGENVTTTATDGGTGSDTSATDISDSVPVVDGNIPMDDNRPIFDGDWEMNTDFFKSNTVYFDFDRSDVRSGERVKVEEVGLYLQRESRNGILIDGHCDERGTEEYNRSLGERRALSVREYLVSLGIDPNRVYTRSFGEDMPAVTGQNQAAYGKNRRGEFILLVPRNP